MASCTVTLGQVHSLLDILEHVPYLLQAVVASCGGWRIAPVFQGLQAFRMVSKSAGAVALKEVHTHCLKLAPETSTTEPLIKVAKLLSRTHLKHLRVDVKVLTGTSDEGNACTADLLS